ncbi:MULTISPECIES: Rho termination factor N-terminal domain-containing protein [Cyanophyceae]|uniref:Rho termination factor N-terminal domain-containing protein n=1 Tax=Cyanophyceae TaxID=3028117 RepID=UPI0016890E8C|nr:Rho termination factor N-terminal domain-containing protein [Trichocoleus sp. FACHB-40]MBD2006865.1 Rho termination factor N-terminal domain-containing protein [Trichocoleus sp. FACHB-40]
MKLSTSLVAVKKINSNVPRSEFLEDELNRTAELILKAEGIINPPVIRRTRGESYEYEVVNGHFEYYAAVKAREIDARKGEMIGAFIIESENEKVLMDQVKVLRNRESNNESSVADTQPLNTVESSKEVIQIESLLPEMESLIDRKLQLISSRISEQNEELLREQVEVLRSREINNESPVADIQPSNTVESSKEVIQIENLLPEIESLIDRKIQQISKNISEHINEFVQKIELILNKPVKVIIKEDDTPSLKEPDYTKMTVPQLKARAKERNIKGSSGMNKTQLIAVLEKVDASHT